MRLIHPAVARRVRDHALAVGLAMLLVGGTSLLLMALLPPTRVAPIALLGLSASLALGIGCAMVLRVLVNLRQRREEMGDDIGRMLAPAFDDSYILVLAPRLPGVPGDLAAVLVGPPGVRALIARRWQGTYRVRGRGWEYHTHSRAGWIPTITNPSFDADAVSEAVARWTRAAIDDPTVTITPAVAFPRSHTTVVLEEPDGEIVTTDNAPWWAQRIGKVQRLDPQRAARFVEAVLAASESEAARTASAPAPRVA